MNELYVCVCYHFGISIHSIYRHTKFTKQPIVTSKIWRNVLFLYFLLLRTDEIMISLFHQTKKFIFNGRKTSSWDYIIDWILFIVKICTLDRCERVIEIGEEEKKAFGILFFELKPLSYQQCIKYPISSVLCTCDVAIYALHFRLPFIFQMV